MNENPGSGNTSDLDVPWDDNAGKYSDKPGKSKLYRDNLPLNVRDYLKFISSFSVSPEELRKTVLFAERFTLTDLD